MFLRHLMKSVSKRASKNGWIGYDHQTTETVLILCWMWKRIKLFTSFFCKLKTTTGSNHCHMRICHQLRQFSTETATCISMIQSSVTLLVFLKEIILIFSNKHSSLWSAGCYVLLRTIPKIFLTLSTNHEVGMVIIKSLAKQTGPSRIHIYSGSRDDNLRSRVPGFTGPHDQLTVMETWPEIHDLFKRADNLAPSFHVSIFLELFPIPLSKPDVMQLLKVFFLQQVLLEMHSLISSRYIIVGHKKSCVLLYIKNCKWHRKCASC